jgi:hypothetical protein
MLSTLSSLADRNFILGFFLPVAVAAVALLSLFQDVPFVADLWIAAQNADSIVALTSVLLAIWLLSALLMIANVPLYQLLEGYWGPLAVAKWSKDAVKSATDARKNIRTLEAAATEASDAYNKMEKKVTADAASAEDLKKAKATRDHAQQAFDLALRDYQAKFPDPPGAALPTEFGNVIRAFETYPSEVYGAEGITTWLRMAGVVSDSFQKILDSAHAEVDFFVNICFLALALAFLAALRLIACLLLWVLPSGLSFDDAFVYCTAIGGCHAWLDLVAMGAALVTSRLSYRFAISRARAWGDLVRSAFDLYLPALARKLGYDLPGTLTDRRRFWKAMNHTFLENRRFDPVPWPAAKRNEDS